MKTFEEALDVTTRLEEIPSGPNMPLRIRNALDLAQEVMGSKLGRDYIAQMVDLSVEHFAEAEEPWGDQVFHTFALSLAATALLAGVRIGQAMEKQELEP